MIGLPTTTTSSTCRASTPAASHSSSISSSSASRTAPVSCVVAARVHHHVRHPAHQVLAEADLRVHPPGRREDLAGGEVAEVAGDRGRADVDRDAARDALGEARATTATTVPSRTATVAAARSVAAAPSAGRPRRAAPARSTAVVAVVDRHAVLLVTAAVAQLVDDARAVGPSTGGELDVVRGHERVDDEVAAGRRPCAPPGGAPGSPPARRSRRRRRCARRSPSRWPGVERPGEPWQSCSVRAARRSSASVVASMRPLRERPGGRARTWQWPQIPRPPHTESRSTPSRRAASSTVVPAATRAARAGRGEHDAAASLASGSGRGPPLPPATAIVPRRPSGYAASNAARRGVGGGLQRRRSSPGRVRLVVRRHSAT